jgi:hypothetical protein
VDRVDTLCVYAKKCQNGNDTSIGWLHTPPTLSTLSTLGRVYRRRHGAASAPVTSLKKNKLRADMSAGERRKHRSRFSQAMTEAMARIEPEVGAPEQLDLFAAEYRRLGAEACKTGSTAAL